MKSTEQDPFSIFLTPPPNETPRERKEREARDAEAQRISNLIDAQLEEDRITLEKDRQVVRVLLLGQSGSGKSTAAKLFRMRYAWKDWDAERTLWRPIIQLNIVYLVLAIVDALRAERQEEISGVSGKPFNAILSRPNTSSTDPLQVERYVKPLWNLQAAEQNVLQWHLHWLREARVDLEKRLEVKVGKEQDGVTGMMDSLNLQTESETFARKGSGDGYTKHSPSSLLQEEGVDKATEIISSCSEGMKALWRDEAVRLVLQKRKIKLEDNAEFFLDNLDRIAQRFYEPIYDDVLHACRRTEGVEEYQLYMERGFPDQGEIFGRQWLLYDVGGSKLLTDAWLSFFDNVHVIIFFVPSSCFDECLSEGSRINRLEESFLLWRSLCSSRLLMRIPIVLFLSKCDVLKRKLDSGVMFRDFVPSFGERSNGTITVVKYLQEIFREQLKERSPMPRISYSHSGSLVENHTILISAIISVVEDSIRRSHLKTVELI